MFQEIMDIPEEKMIENAYGVLDELDGIKLTTKIRLHLGLMQSIIEIIMASGKLDQPEPYTLLIDLGNDLEELVEKLKTPKTKYCWLQSRVTGVHYIAQFEYDYNSDGYNVHIPAHPFHTNWTTSPHLQSAFRKVELDGRPATQKEYEEKINDQA